MSGRAFGIYGGQEPARCVIRHEVRGVYKTAVTILGSGGAVW
jgi:putative transposon-encoded protein